MKQGMQKPSPFMAKAEKVIFSQQGLLMAVRRTAWFLFCHEMTRKDPATGTLYTPRKALSNTLRWMDEQAEFMERVKQEPTQLQRRMLQMLANGMSGKQIAYKLGIHEKTIRTYFRRLKAKLGVETMYQVVGISVKMGWIVIRQPERHVRKRSKPL